MSHKSEPVCLQSAVSVTQVWASLSSVSSECHTSLSQFVFSQQWVSHKSEPVCLQSAVSVIKNKIFLCCSMQWSWKHMIVLDVSNIENDLELPMENGNMFLSSHLIFNFQILKTEEKWTKALTVDLFRSTASPETSSNFYMKNMNKIISVLKFLRLSCWVKSIDYINCNSSVLL